jgi:hypothetical protein
MWPFVGAFMLVSLMLRPGIRIPGNLAIWVLFLAWMLVSAVALDSTGRVIGFALRFSFYASAGVLFLYLYNSPRISSRAILISLAGYWVLIVIGGYLGVFLPRVAFHTPIEHVLPGSLLANSYVHDMTYAKFAENQSFLGYPIGRPATFFTYTNGWGSGFALVAPFAIAAIAETRSARWRRVLVVTVVLSIVPVIVSLNRGLWISVIVAGLYVLLRLLGARDAAGARRFLGLVGVLAVLIAVSPLGSLVQQRLVNGDSNPARHALYQETFARVNDSPLIGYGAPRPAQASGYLDSVGTQGQVLYLVFSHGYPGLLLFLGWLVHAFLKSVRPPSPAAMAGHVTLLIALVQAPFYGLLTQIFVVAAAGALALRETDAARRRAVSPPAEPAVAQRWSKHPVPAW